jgi:hypothetical protein
MGLASLALVHQYICACIRAAGTHTEVSDVTESLLFEEIFYLKYEPFLMQTSIRKSRVTARPHVA